MNKKIQINFNNEKINIIEERWNFEHKEINDVNSNKNRKLKEEELKGRQSGSTQWKQQRGELGNNNNNNNNNNNKNKFCNVLSNEEDNHVVNDIIFNETCFKFDSFPIDSQIQCNGNAKIMSNKLILTGIN